MKKVIMLAAVVAALASCQSKANISQKRQGSRISFEQVAEELETSFAVGTIFKNT